MTTVPKDEKEMDTLRENLFENPLFINRIISKDGKTTAIYAPLEKGANGKEIADQVRATIKKEKAEGPLPGDEKYYMAGDPVAGDTFGSESRAFRDVSKNSLLLARSPLLLIM
jgi:hypothetical protein